MVNKRNTQKFMPKLVTPKLNPIGGMNGEPLILPNHSGIASHPEAKRTYATIEYVDSLESGLWENITYPQLKIAKHITMQDKKIMNMADPFSDQDGATKIYVDNQIASIDPDDNKVAVDTNATEDFLGALSTDGVLRASSTLTYTDGGNYITLGVNPNLALTTLSMGGDIDCNNHNIYDIQTIYGSSAGTSCYLYLDDSQGELGGPSGTSQLWWTSAGTKLQAVTNSQRITHFSSVLADNNTHVPTGSAVKSYVDDEIDGIDLSVYLNKDGTTNLTGTWTITQDISFDSDTKGIIFGDGQDSTFYFNGTEMEITDVGLIIGGTGTSEFTTAVNFLDDTNTDGVAYGTMTALNFGSAYAKNSDGYLKMAGYGDCYSTRGYRMPFDGYIVAISSCFRTTSYTASGIARMYAKVNGTNKIYCDDTISSTSTGGDGGTATATQGTHSFSAGDIISAYYDEVAPLNATIDDIGVIIWVVFKE